MMNTFFPNLRRMARSLGLLSVGVLSTLGVLSLSHVGPAQAQSPGVNLAALVAQVNTLKSTVTNQGNTITTLQTNLTTETTRATNAESALQTRASTLETKTAPLSVSNDPYAGGTNTLLTITGVNVQLVNGLGATNGEPVDPQDYQNAVVNGLGNLIIGYNETRGGTPSLDVRTGSHNLILGIRNSYSAFGGIVAGNENTISAGWATVTGGFYNTASGVESSVGGGSSNKASNFEATVSGGIGQTESNQYGWAGGYYHSPP